MEIAKVSCKSFPKLWSLFQPSAALFPPPTERPHTHVFLLAFPKFRSCRLAFWLEASFGRLFLHLLFENYCCIVLKKGCNCSCTFPLPRYGSFRLVLPTISLLFLVFCLCFMAYMGTTYVLSAFWRIALTDYKWNAAWRRPILPPFFDFLRSRAKKWKFVLLLFCELLQGREREGRTAERVSWRETEATREKERESGWVDGCFVCSALCLGVAHPPFLDRSVLQSRVVVCFIMMTAQAPDAAPSSSARWWWCWRWWWGWWWWWWRCRGYNPCAMLLPIDFPFLPPFFVRLLLFHTHSVRGKTFFQATECIFCAPPADNATDSGWKRGWQTGFAGGCVVWCGMVGGGWCVVYRVFACIERIHLACLRLAEKSGKEITDDKEMSENSFQPALQPTPAPHAPFSAVVFHSISLFSAFYYDQSFLAWHIQHGCGYNLPAFCYPLPPFLRFFLYLSNLLPGHHPCQWLLGFILLLFVEFFVFWGSHNLNSNEISYLLFFFLTIFH